MTIRDLHHERNHHRKAGAFRQKVETLEVQHCWSCGKVYDLGPKASGGFCSNTWIAWLGFWRFMSSAK